MPSSINLQVNGKIKSALKIQRTKKLQQTRNGAEFNRETESQWDPELNLE